MQRSPLLTRVIPIAPIVAILLACWLMPAAGFASCGDGVVDGGEACDLGGRNGPTSCCTVDCELRGSSEICRSAAGACDVDDACDGTNPECPTALGRNVALAGTATQSSSLGLDTGAANAIDGNTSGEFIHGSVTHTIDADQDWWEVDLGSVQPIKLIRIWNRTDCCSGRLRDFHVILSDDPFDSGELAATLAQSGVTAFFHPGEAATMTNFDIERSARYVRIQQLGEVLQLAEVQVFETSDDKVAAGTECRAAAGPCDTTETCNGFDDDCPADAFLGSFAQCRSSAGVCDPSEFCDGSGPACPADTLEEAGTPCRAAAGPCDAAESCDGASVACPVDELHPAGLLCRAPTGFKDFAETCDGSAAYCPVDAGRCAGYFDPSFSGGLVATNPGLSWSYLFALAEQPDGKVLGVGATSGDLGDGYRDFLAVARYRLDGSLDPDFGDGGLVLTAPPGFEYNYGLAVVVQDDGKIIAAAESYSDLAASGMVYVRYHVDGSLDAEWGADGVAVVEDSEGDGYYLTDIALDANGRLIAAGVNWNDALALIRFDPNGQRDLTFGDAGTVTHDVGTEVTLRDVIVQGDGKIVVAASGQYPGNGRDFILVRMNPDGSLDEGFGTAGVVTSHFTARDFIRSVLLQPDGKILAAGDTGDSSSLRTASLVRYLANGSLDSDFGTGGLATAPHGSIRTNVVRAARLPDGSIHAVRTWEDSNSHSNLVVTVFRQDGSVATEIGDAGFVVAPIDPGYVNVYDMMATQDSKLVVAGQYEVDAQTRFLVARLHGRCVGEAWLGYKAKAPKADATGTPILDDNQLPAPWSVALGDALLAPASDSLENFEIGKVQHVLRRALVNAGRMAADGDAAYVRYAARAAKQGAGAPVNGKYPKAIPHLPRAWELENQFGTVRVVSQKTRAMLVPAAADLGATPLPPEAADPFVCYSVKATKDVTAQTPDAGNGIGKLRRDMQIFLADHADVCALARDGNPSFAGSTAEGSCLVDLGKPIELCNRASLAAAAPPRVTTATDVEEVMANEGDSLLCYAVKLSAKITSPDVASTLGAAIGVALSPKQSKPITHSAKQGNPLLTTPGANFAAPRMLDTKGQAIACLATRVVSIGTLP